MHKCSLCGNEVASQDLTPYCAYCGAKMKENIDE
jgi:DNA-directed RNA polymerase subunit RPC12/RpoP